MKNVSPHSLQLLKDDCFSSCLCRMIMFVPGMKIKVLMTVSLSHDLVSVSLCGQLKSLMPFIMNISTFAHLIAFCIY